MNIVIVGGGGYLGTTLIKNINKDFKIKVIDRFYFGKDFLLSNNNIDYLQRDIESISVEDLTGYSVLIDLAGLSNDPSCDLSEDFTNRINYKGAMHLASTAKNAGVLRYIYSSSCSVYGFTNGNKCTETSETKPISLYAKVKCLVEDYLESIADDSFEVVCLRNATLFGLSPRMRFDLVINMMTKYAFQESKIYVMGGGKQSRPLLHVSDCAAVIENFIQAKLEENFLVLNVGSEKNNHTVHEIAVAVKQTFYDRDINVILLPEDDDRRSYMVNFDSLTKFIDNTSFKDILYGSREIKNALDSGLLNPNDPRWMTVQYLNYLLGAKKTLDEILIDGRLL
jgi:nucleoside-diphosphate-sugar epimerase